MKLYVFTLKKLLFNVAAIALVATVICLNYNNSQTVFRSGKSDELPIYSVETEKKVCALTFDAAWGADDTDELIRILKEYNAKATFFVVGDWVEKYPDEVKKLSDAGHDVMNHSDTHPYMTRIDANQIVTEIKNCSKKIEAITNKKVNLFRAPYGDYNSNLIKKMRNMGYYTIQWDVDSLDWQDISAEEIYERVITKTKNGSVILFHNAAKNTPEALPKILKKLKDDGFEFVKVSDMIYKKNFYIDNAGRQFYIR